MVVDDPSRSGITRCTLNESEKRQLPLFRFVVENGPTIERRRDRLLVSNHRVEIGSEFDFPLDQTNKGLQPTKTVDLVAAAEFSRIE